jgi:hypothetical protein
MNALQLRFESRNLKPATQIENQLSLPLFMFRVDANHSHHAFAVNDLALVTHFLDRRPHFHLINLESFFAKPLFVTVSNSSAIKVVRRELYEHSITRKDSNEMLAHLSRNMRQHLMLSLFQRDPKHSVRQGLKDRGHNLYSFFLRHIRSERMLPVPTNCK